MDGVRRMANIEQEDKRNADGVSLLVSILVCYPEIGTISFDPANESLKMTFVLNCLPEQEQYILLEQRLKSSVLSYLLLEGLKATAIEVRREDYDHLAFINVIRDVATMSRGEIALISEIMREHFSDHLVMDNNESIMEEDLLVQEEVIDRMLFSLNKNRDVSKLIGIREDGRVLIFNK